MYLGPDGSFPIHGEAELEKIKAAIRRVDFSKAPVAIPQGMTAGDYQNLNILPGNRIGWEQKQEHLHRLSDLYTLGYLTEEEYEKRMEWVNTAQTVEQVNIVFTDLRRNILTAEAGSYLEPAAVKDSRRLMTIIWMFIIIATGILTAMHAWAEELVMIAGVVVIAEAPRYHDLLLNRKRK